MTTAPLVAPEIARALAEGRGIVALESTLITHGLPAPDNVAVALASEAAVRAAGAVPATVAVLGGAIRVGLTGAEIEALARTAGVFKASRRDLGACVARAIDAATTVSATLRVARLAGIGVMATGGLGGVHRGAGATFDVSTDLDELARADGMALVCAGAKSILDIPGTLELLETRGVPVVGYGTDTFPAFTAESSGCPVEHRVDSPAEATRVVRAHRALGLPGAVVIAQPVPAEVAVPGDLMAGAIDSALAAAAAAGVVGKAVTPFLLDRVRQATGGRSLVANKALIVANAALAGRIAALLAPARFPGAV